MTQYKRITGKVFGGNATATGNDPQIAQFGSALAGTFIGTTDPQTIQQLPAWGEGWSGAVTPETQFPPMPEMTGAMKVLSHQICGILQQGVSTWDSGTIYYTGNFCSKNGAVYVSLTDKNQGNDPVSDTANWRSYGGANLDLSNLSATGEKHFLNKSQITNCLLEIPQRIKYTLENGTLTIKAGSVVIVPYGTEDKTSQYPVGSVFINDNFKVYDTQFEDGKFFVWAEVQSDIVSNNSASTTEINQKMCLTINDNHTTWQRNTESGTSTSTATQKYTIYYNTEINLVGMAYEDVNIDYTETLSLIFLEVTCLTSNTGWKSVDQVFNGMGYIGSTVWVDKGVKVLIPNGRNKDGTLKNIEVTTPKVLINFSTPFKPNVNTTRYEVRIGGTSANNLALNRHTVNSNSYYDFETNLFYRPDGTQPNSVAIARITSEPTNGITEFEQILPFCAVDYNDALLKSDKAEIINWGMPDYSSGIEPTFPFTAPSDGVLYFSLLANNASGNFYINGVFVAFYADNADGAVRDNYTFIVSRGDVVSGFGFEFARFFPLKGAK